MIFHRNTEDIVIVFIGEFDVVYKLFQKHDLPM